MKLKERLQLHWRCYGRTERVFVLLPFLILTPRLLNHLNGDHNGEPSQEFVIALALLGTLILLGVEARRNSNLSFHWQGRNAWLLLATTLFALWSGASLLWTSDVGATQDHTGLWLSYTALLFVGRIVLRRRSVLGLTATLITACLAVAVFRLFQYWVSVGDRSLASPIYKNVGVEPELLVTILPLILVIHLTARRQAVAWSSFIVAAVVWMGSLSTYQRTPMLASVAAVGLLSFGLLMKWLVPRSPQRLAALIVVLILAGGLQLSLPAKVQGENPVGAESGKDFVVKQVKGISSMETDTSSRLQFWGAAIEMGRAHPVLGVGAGAYKTNYTAYRRVANLHPYWGRIKDPSQLEGTECTYRAHNEFLEVLGELGFTGLALLSAILLALAGLLWKTPPQQRWLALSVGAGALAFLISSSLSSFSFRWIPCGFTFFLLVALILPLNKAKGSTSKLEKSIRYGRWAIAFSLLLCAFGVRRTAQVMWSQHYEFQAQAHVATDQERSIKLYQKALATDPYNFTAAAELGELFYRHKRPQDAIPYLAYGTRHGSNHIFHHALLSFAYAQVGQRTHAREVLQQAVEAYPGSVFTRALYAEALEQEGNSQIASEQRAKMRSLHAENAAVWELIIRNGVKAATLATQQQKLTHPARLQPRNGMDVLQERERLLQKP